MNLWLFILVPAATALAVLLVKKPASVKITALAGSVIQLALAISCFFLYREEREAGNTAQMLFEQTATWFPSLHISLHLGIDGISLSMLLLTTFVVLAGVLVSWNVEKMTKEFYFLLLLLATGAYGFFISLDVVMIFFFLEIAVIPKYLLIAIWGSGRKEYSANKLAIMLFGASALIFLGMMGMYFSMDEGTRSFDLVAISKQHLSLTTQHIFFPLLFIGFGVFGALFPFHTWVPDGHSSAPTAGSMFLAGISMKLGGYGCLRIATYLMPDGAKEYAQIIILLSAISILYGAFATMMQKDLKYLNAYSSVSHCGFVLLGIGMLTKTAMTGAVLQMVSHGLMTALFFAVIGMIYERTHTRIISEMGGLMKLMPFTATVFFIAGLCSLGLPGLSGFVAEMTVFVGSWQHAGIFYRVATIAACASIVVTAVYILRAIGQVAMGPLKHVDTVSYTDASWNERIASVVLIAGILVIGTMPFWLNNLVAPSIEIIVNRLNGK